VATASFSLNATLRVSVCVCVSFSLVFVCCYLCAGKSDALDPPSGHRVRLSQASLQQVEGERTRRMNCEASPDSASNGGTSAVMEAWILLSGHQEGGAVPCRMAPRMHCHEAGAQSSTSQQRTSGSHAVSGTAFPFPLVQCQMSPVTALQLDFAVASPGATRIPFCGARCATNQRTRAAWRTGLARGASGGDSARGKAFG
jgi:hypothetical protein